jgi:RNA polymerase sigma-70 factor (ECF subfamily)
MNHSDEELIEQYKNGDEIALPMLITRYFDMIYRYAYRFVNNTAAAEDIVQETFIKVWKYNSSHAKGAMVKPWLFRIAHNTAIDYIRKKKLVNFSELQMEEEVEFPDTNTDILEESIAREAREKLTATLETLPARYREILVLRAEEQLTFEEIGEVLGKPVNTVKSLYRRGLLLLKETLA